MKIGFIGAGSMASALARGLGEPALVSDVDRGARRGAGRGDRRRGRRLERRARRARPTSWSSATSRRSSSEVADEVGGARQGAWPRSSPPRRSRSSRPPTRTRRSTASSRTSRSRSAAGCSATRPGTLAAEGPSDELLELLGRAGTVIAARRAADRARDGDHELRPRVPRARGRGAGRRRRRARPRSRPRRTRLVVETMAGSAAYLDANGARRAPGCGGAWPPRAA